VIIFNKVAILTGSYGRIGGMDGLHLHGDLTICVTSNNRAVHILQLAL
jgi:hypothetical protein